MNGFESNARCGGGRFTTAIIERRRGRKTSAKEAMAEMHLAGAP